LPPLDNRFIELDDLARARLPVGRKPSLATLAASLGVVLAHPGFAVSDAEAAARIVLAARRQRPPADEPAAALSLGAGTGEPPAGHTRGEESNCRPSRPLVSRDWLGSITTGPGVYQIEDQAGRVLYIGKAVNLRRRLAVYASRAPTLHRSLDALVARAASVSVRETPSDLEATLLEARLLARVVPPFNVARVVRQRGTYIRIGLGDDPPRVQIVRAVAIDGASYIGPLRSTRLAQQALAVARLAFPAAFERRSGDAERRRNAAIGVTQLLGGQKEASLAALRTTMTRAAAVGDQRALDRARDGLRRVRSLTLEASALLGLPAAGRVLVVERVSDDRLRAHLIGGERHLGASDADISTWPADGAEQRAWARQISASITPEPVEGDGDSGVHDSVEIDESTIVTRWLSQSRAVLGVYPLD